VAQLRPAVAALIEFYTPGQGRCPGGGDTGGKFRKAGDPNCGRENVDTDDKIQVKDANSVERYVLDKLRNEPKFVTKRSGPASSRKFVLKNGWKVKATRKEDGSYSLRIDTSGGSPADADKAQ